MKAKKVCQTGLRQQGIERVPFCCINQGKKNHIGLVPEWLISANPGLKFCSVFVFYLPMYFLEEHKTINDQSQGKQLILFQK